MRRYTRRRSQRRGQAGFTLMEVMVAGLVLIIGLIAISQFFSSAMARVMDSKTRSILHQVASEEIEKVRALKYADVGLVDSMPGGTLLAHEEKAVQGMTVVIDRDITFVQDATYTGPYPANYRRVTIRVSADPNKLEPVVLTTNVAGGAAGGAFYVTVRNSHGDPVPDAYIVITNTHLSPHVNIDSPAIRTDSAGNLLVPGLTPDATNSYKVQANKAGYNSDWKDQLTVQDGVTQTVPLIIDPLATLIVHTQLADGTPVGNLHIHVSNGGKFAYSWAGPTDAGGIVTLEDLTSSLVDNGGHDYTATLDTGQGYTAGPSGVTLMGGSTTDLVLTVAPIVTTTTTAATTTTTGAGTTTTTVPTGNGSVRVNVWRPNGNLLGNPTIIFRSITSHNNPATFSNVPFGTYLLTVSKSNWKPDPYTGNNNYQVNVDVNGNEVIDVQMQPN